MTANIQNNLDQYDKYYEALQDKETAKGLNIILGVSSTGIFCRPGCPARLPLRKNCLFFENVSGALQQGLRPCKRCYPLGGKHADLDRVIESILATPDSDWSEKGLKDKGYAPTTLRRQFKRHTGFGLKDFVRWVRLGRASSALSKGESVIMAQLDAGFESASGFRAAFGEMFGMPPAKSKMAVHSPLCVAWHETPFGRMVSIADDEALYMLEFTNRVKMLDQIKRLHRLHARPIITGRKKMSEQIETELKAYFKGELQHFETPFILTGTDFQKQTWHQLSQIPYGETRSYADLAVAVGNEKAVRAVAGSNAKNGLALIVPCHRVIAKDGTLGGYAGGLDRKRALLRLEGASFKDG
jgi:AraC family transcriptional regulator of adaptative response/methylated-DNA-[protein]-cysteine methyltransferase